MTIRMPARAKGPGRLRGAAGEGSNRRRDQGLQERPAFDTRSNLITRERRRTLAAIRPRTSPRYDKAVAQETQNQLSLNPIGPSNKLCWG
jgi:hypothetical protein